MTEVQPQTAAQPVTTQKLLMCKPAFFDIEYSINPWMDVRRKAQTNRSLEQWTALKDTFEALGVDVLLIEPQVGLPDMVFIDAGLIDQGRFVPSNFYHPERQGERKYFVEWFAQQGYEIVDIPAEFYWEGHGDTLWAGDKLFFGYGVRSCVEAQHYIRHLLDVSKDVIPVELVDTRFYHLDTTFCPLDSQTAFFFPGGVSYKARRMLEQHIELIPISESDALKFACNSVVLGQHVIMPEGADGISQALTERGYTVHPLAMDEFIKAGGACKCLSMPLA